MLSALTDADVVLSKNIGMYTQPGIASAYPELSSMLRIMYRDRFAKLPFVPDNWFSQVDAIHGQNGDIILPIPAYDTLNRISPNLPAWLDTDAKRQAWDAARNIMKTGYTNFTQNQINVGRDQMNAAYANVAFWQRLTDAAQYLADIPKKIITATWNTLWPYILLTGGSVALYLWWKSRKGNK